MPLLEQWRQKFPWISETFAILAGSSLGLGAIANPLTPFTSATISSPIDNQWEHPLRGQILSTLQKSPGIHFRELQRQLSAANGTLRHHLRVLINEKSVTTVPVNGRTCYYAGAPAQVEILEGRGLTDQSKAAAMLPVGLSTVQRNIINHLSTIPRPTSQAQLARDIGKSRTTVHSAVSVLRNRGLISFDNLSLAPHLENLRWSDISYPWIEISEEIAQ